MSDIWRGSNQASGVVTTADLMSLNATGGTEATTTTTSPSDVSTTKWMEVLSQGGTGTDSASAPAPTSLGWISGTQLEGQTIPAGNWSASIGISDNNAPTMDLEIVFSKRASGGTFTTIGTITTTGQSIASTRTSVSFSATSMSAMSFATSDKLAVNVFSKSTSPGWLGDLVKIYLSNSSSSGVAGDLEVTTPTHVATGSGPAPASTLALMGVG